MAMTELQLEYDETHYGAGAARPDIHGILIHGKRGRLLSVLYTAGGEGLHPVVLFLHGIPGCEKNLDLAQALRRAGFHVLIFHYSGSWGSDGNYSLAHTLEDADTALDFILQDNTYGFDKEHVYALSHSLGGFVCGQLAAKRPEIKGAVLLMPCDIGRLPQIEKENPRAYKAVLDVLKESADLLTGTSEEALLREILEHSAEFALENVARNLLRTPILSVGGTLDTDIPPELHCDPLARAIQSKGGTLLQRVDFPTDHAFSDYRLAVTQTVVHFLKGLVSGK